MAGGFPHGFEFCNGTELNAATTTVNANAAANTLGSWTQITASSAIDASMIQLDIVGYVNVGPSVAVDVGVGSAGNEVIVAQQLLCSGFTSPGSQTVSYLIPCNIPSGTRIACRCQSSGTNDGAFIHIKLYDGAMTNFEGFAGIDSIGFDSTHTEGAQLDPGGVLNTKGSYAQLTASTSRDYAGFYLAFDCQGETVGITGANTFTFSVDFAIGAGGSEQILIPDLQVDKFYCNTASPIVVVPAPVLYGIYWIPLPSGVRVAARSATGSTTTSPNRLMGITAYGIYQ